MTDAQFDALAQLLRSPAGAQQDAARMVLVGGLRQVDAARAVGASTAAVGNTVRAYRRGLALARKVVLCAMADPTP